MRVRNLIREDIRRAVARKMPYVRNGSSATYDAVELTPEVIAEIEAARPEDRRAIHVMPNSNGGGIPAAIDLLKVTHPMQGGTGGKTGAHSFEMRNVNEQIGFQFVMSERKYQERFARQLETFYPASNIDVDELTTPEVLPYHEGWFAATCHLEFLLQDKPVHQRYPWAHVDIDNMDNDPMGAISAEMIGEREAEFTTNVATQTVFQPAPVDWHKGGFRTPSVDDAADDIAQRTKKPSAVKLMGQAFTKNGLDLSNVEATKQETTGEDTKAAEAIRKQRNQVGFHVNIRIIAIGQSPEKAIERVDDTADMYAGFYDSDTGQGLKTVPHEGRELLESLQYIARREFIDRGMTIGIRGFASAVHMPNKNSNTRNVPFIHTTGTGDVPPDADRFSDWMADEIEWDTYDRSVAMDPDEWIYDIEQRQPTVEEIEEAEQRKLERQRREGTVGEEPEHVWDLGEAQDQAEATEGES